MIDMRIDEFENKDYLAQLVNTVANVILESFENITIEDVNMYRLGYNMGIDDFADILKENISESIIWGMIADCFKYKNMNDTSDKIVDYLIDTANEISEQLKEGV